MLVEEIFLDERQNDHCPLVLSRDLKDTFRGHIIDSGSFEIASNSLELLGLVALDPYRPVYLDPAFVRAGNVSSIAGQIHALNSQCEVFSYYKGRGEILSDCSVNITQKQQKVLTMLAQGWSAKNVADKCELSEETVHDHVELAKDKLGASNQTAAVIMGLRLGLINPPEIPYSYLVRELENSYQNTLLYLSKGFTNKEIAAKLNISNNTVATYLKQITNETEISGRVALAVAAIQSGLVDPITLTLNQA